MKKLDFKSKNIEELQKSLKEAQKEYFDLNIDNNLRKLKNVKSLNFKRKEIAKLKTEITNKELNNER